MRTIWKRMMRWFRGKPLRLDIDATAADLLLQYGREHGLTVQYDMDSKARAVRIRFVVPPELKERENG